MALSLRRTAQRPPLSDSPAARWRPDVYLTDGVDLFRTLSPSLVETGPGFVALEDCRTLDVILCSFEDLADRKLRTVRR